MRQYTLLRLLLAAFLLYFAWPYIPDAATTTEKLFWGTWLGFLLLAIGGNLATMLDISSPPIMEQKSRIRNRMR